MGKAMHIGFLENSILASERYAWIGVLVVGVWQAVAMNTIIYISGLQTVPADIYEAGMIDGANPWQKFWKLTFPMLLPFVSINLILSTKNMMMVFDQIMSLTKGGPAQSTESISYLIYKNGMDGGQFGFQSANAVVFFIVIVAFIYLIEVISVMMQVTWFKYTKKKYGEGRRIFKMAPLHHHFQESGYTETQVVAAFAVVTAILCLIGYLGL